VLLSPCTDKRCPWAVNALLPGGVCRAELSQQSRWNGICEHEEGGEVGTEKQVLTQKIQGRRDMDRKGERTVSRNITTGGI